MQIKQVRVGHASYKNTSALLSSSVEAADQNYRYIRRSINANGLYTCMDYIRNFEKLSCISRLDYFFNFFFTVSIQENTIFSVENSRSRRNSLFKRKLKTAAMRTELTWSAAESSSRTQCPETRTQRKRSWGLKEKQFASQSWDNLVRIKNKTLLAFISKFLSTAFERKTVVQKNNPRIGGSLPSILKSRPKVENNFWIDEKNRTFSFLIQIF